MSLIAGLRVVPRNMPPAVPLRANSARNVAVHLSHPDLRAENYFIDLSLIHAGRPISRIIACAAADPTMQTTRHACPFFLPVECAPAPTMYELVPTMGPYYCSALPLGDCHARCARPGAQCTSRVVKP